MCHSRVSETAHRTSFHSGGTGPARPDVPGFRRGSSAAGGRRARLIGEYPDHVADPSNVLGLNKMHHAAFDRALFTIDQEYRLRVNPHFDTDSEVLHRMIIDRGEKQITIPETSLDPESGARVL